MSGRFFVRLILSSQPVFGGLKAYCNVSNFSEMDQ
jgi:hypothetical protein